MDVERETILSYAAHPSANRREAGKQVGTDLRTLYAKVKE